MQGQVACTLSKTMLGSPVVHMQLQIHLQDVPTASADKRTGNLRGSQNCHSSTLTRHKTYLFAEHVRTALSSDCIQPQTCCPGSKPSMQLWQNQALVESSFVIGKKPACPCAGRPAVAMYLCALSLFRKRLFRSLLSTHSIVLNANRARSALGSTSVPILPLI